MSRSSNQQSALVLRDRADGVASFQKQQRGGEDTLADGGQAIAPRGVQLADLAVGEPLTGNGRHQALAGRRVGARQRDQVLHGRVRRQRAAPHVVLNSRRQFLHQCQPPAHPAHRPRKAPTEIVQRQRETTGELVQQPPLLQCRRALAGAHQPVQDQRLRLAQIPTRGGHEVLSEPAQRPHPLVAVHQHEALGGLSPDNHHRDLLADVRQRRQQLALGLGLAHAQRLVPQVELVQLEVHGAGASRPAAPRPPPPAPDRQPRSAPDPRPPYRPRRERVADLAPAEGTPEPIGIGGQGEHAPVRSIA
jgi:hypothetical protein